MGRHANAALFIPHAGCPHRCSFCDQKAISGTRCPPGPAEVEAVCRRAADTARGDPSEREIAFFGGSFTAIPREYRESLLKAAAPFIQAGRFRGIRISTRPDAVDEGILERLKAHGVTAVELGAQSMDDRVLRRNERGHTAAQVEQAAARIRKAGLELGLQMMTGLPGASSESDRETARRLAALCPDTVRVYPTLVMRNTRLADWFAAGEYRPPSLEEAVSLCTELLWFFERERGVAVIRLGLHAEADLESGLLAGPWHPAFRELCESRVYLEEARRALAGIPPGEATLWVCPAAVSKMIGQKRCNLEELRRDGWICRVRADGGVPVWSVRADAGQNAAE